MPSSRIAFKLPVWVLSQSERWFGFYFSSQSADSLEYGLVVMLDNVVCHIALAHNETKYFIVITASTILFFIIQFYIH